MTRYAQRSFPSFRPSRFRDLNRCIDRTRTTRNVTAHEAHRRIAAKATRRDRSREVKEHNKNKYTYS